MIRFPLIVEIRKLSSWCSRSCRGRRAIPWQASMHRRSPRNAGRTTAVVLPAFLGERRCIEACQGIARRPRQDREHQELSFLISTIRGNLIMRLFAITLLLAGFYGDNDAAQAQSSCKV